MKKTGYLLLLVSTITFAQNTDPDLKRNLDSLAVRNAQNILFHAKKQLVSSNFALQQQSEITRNTHELIRNTLNFNNLLKNDLTVVDHPLYAQPYQNTANQGLQTLFHIPVYQSK
ncbi:hypothetical protein [Chryseobacterium lacus]|uniref:hypothetical protein n=1 Tax=Chryseobacterium lacus TaxID=2058346 RepID=UPI000F87426F|nr:hypothetical protein [Chryseobacterium lacus]RST27651.1 hypothetical protein EIZ46_04905 [Chryseobacterium lacus]